MDEQEIPNEVPVEDEPTTDERTAKDAIEMIGRLNAATERQEKATKALKDQLDRQEVLRVQQTIGGTADAGPAQPKEETDKEYADKVMSGEVQED